MNAKLPHALTLTTLSLITTAAALGQNAASEPPLEETVVTATLLPEDAGRASITVLGSGDISQRSAQHLEDLLSAAPNVNVASGASRGRFFQIRGVGERSQFVEPVNASIAMLLDGIDFTGLGGAATTWDLEQVEILRGPQGTLFGANALAGLINLQSRPADAGSTLKLSAGLENYSGYRVGAVVGGQLSDHWSGRLSAQQYESDGYLDNRWLDRSDTNARDEFTGRIGFARVTENQRLDITVYRIDVDNGYDAFSLDNTRETLSDQPGRDRIQTDAARILWQRDGDIQLSAQASAAFTETEYSYDVDWAYEGIAPGWEYSAFDRYLRDRDMVSLEFRASSQAGNVSWVAGSYLRREEESLARSYTYLAIPFASQLDIDTGALFGQIDTEVAPNLAAYVGARLERRRTDYRDSQSVDEDLSDSLWSGRAGLEWSGIPNHQFYLGLSRGVRSGGVNAGLLASLGALPDTTAAQLYPLGYFDEEYLINTELGWRWQPENGSIRSELTLFSMRRRDQQAKRSLVLPRTDGSTEFIDYSDNAAESSSEGLEWQLVWRPLAQLEVNATVGLLNARFDDYVTQLGEDLSDREQPHAPDRTARIALKWQPTESLQAGIDLTSMDGFYFSDRHDTRSPSRKLVNAFLGWKQGQWHTTIWGRNLADEDYFTRGFGSFGNDPRKEYVTEPYYQYGEPRVFGVTIEYVR